MSNKILKELAEEWQPKFKTCKMLGSSVSDLREEELRTLIYLLGENEKKYVEEKLRIFEMFKLFSSH